MTDRKKVIEELENYEPYARTFSNLTVKSWIVTSVLALLKEQEAVEPIPPTDESDLWKCGNCNHQLFRCTHQRYCEMCGRAVKWE